MTKEQEKPVLAACPFCGGEAKPISNYRMSGVCVGCEHSIENPHPAIQCLYCGGVMMNDAAAWNRRYVCPDKNDKPVYAGAEVMFVPSGQTGKTKRGCKCIVTELRPPRYGYGLVGDNDYTNHLFYPSEIELIEESDGEE